MVGTWNFGSYCLDESFINDTLTASCPAARFSNFNVTRTGSMVFTATDYATASIASVAFTYTFPQSCIVDPSLTCGAFGDSLAGTPDYQSASCTGSTMCICQLVTTPSTTTESGTYTTSGGTLNTMPTGGTPGTVSYCVQGDRLTLLDIDATTMRTRATQVLQRQ